MFGSSQGKPVVGIHYPVRSGMSLSPKLSNSDWNTEGGIGDLMIWFVNSEEQTFVFKQINHYNR